MLAVTGATGFVGRHVCAALNRAGLPFRPIARDAVPGHAAVGDIGPETPWREALQGISGVIHLAGRVHRMHEQDADTIEQYRRTNLHGTLRLAREAQACGVRRLVFVSTIKVNGETTSPGQPFRADDPVNPSDAYARSKWEAEQDLWAVAAETGLEVVVVRPPLVYGSGVGANFRALASLAARGLPLPLAGIQNRRSLIAASNLADLLLRCATQPDAPGNTFLCSDGEDVSTPDLLRAVARALGKTLPLFPIPAWALTATGAVVGRREAVKRLTESLQVDMGATCTRLQWRPPTTMAEALQAAFANRKVETPP